MANLSCFEYLLGAFHAFVHRTLTPGGRHYYLHFFKEMKGRDIKHPIQGHPQRATGGATSQVQVCLDLSLPPCLPMLPPSWHAYKQPDCDGCSQVYNAGCS